MKNLMQIAAGMALLGGLSGCATNIYPGGPTPSGALFSSTRSTAAALAVNLDEKARPTKSGQATSAAILGLIGFGDSSVTAAMEEAGITRIHHVDYASHYYFGGIYVGSTTIVYGE